MNTKLGPLLLLTILGCAVSLFNFYPAAAKSSHSNLSQRNLAGPATSPFSPLAGAVPLSLPQKHSAPSRHKSNGPIFFNPVNYVLNGVYASSSAVGDFNGDGKPDLVITEQCPANNCSVGGVVILLGNGDGTFTLGQSYSSGGYEAYAVAVADLNGDGKKDIVVANGCLTISNCNSGGVGVLLGNGDGTFQPAQSYSSAGIVASDVVIANVNGDGKYDLIVTNQCFDSTCASGGVSILIGKGDGTFQAGNSYTTGGLTAVSVVVADFNGDGKQDLAVANQCATTSDCTGNVGILLRSGPGQFQPAVAYSTGGYKATSIAAGDFNGDKRIDLAITAQCQSSSNCTLGTVSVLLGNGDGSFRSSQNYSSAGNVASSVAVVQLSNNGIDDLVVTNQCQTASSCVQGLVDVLLGNGDGTFKSAQGYVSEGIFAQSAAIADFKRNGKADVAVVNQCQSGSACTGTVTILLGNGDGTLQSPPSYTTPGYDADAVAVGDLNGDGKPDMVIADLCKATNCPGGFKEGLVYVLLGNGDGTFQPAQSYGTGGYGTTSVAIADVNGDGKADVITSNQCGAPDCSGSASVSILLGNGDGSLRSAQTYSTAALTSLSVAISDLNHDKKPDLVVASKCQDSSCANGAVSVLLGRGDGTFNPATVYASGGYYTDFITVGDFNQDGNPDLAVASQCYDSTCQIGGASVFLGNGDGTFKTAQPLNSNAWQTDGITVADFNGDGIPDLAASNACVASDCSQGSVSIWLGRGDGTFRGAHVFGTGGQTSYSLVAADFNGDGPIDLAVSNSAQTAVLLGNGDGTFQNPQLYYPGGVFATMGDLNGDKQPDVMIAGGGASNVTVLMNIVSGYRLATATSITSNPNPSAVFQSVLFTSSVSSPLGGTPTGSVGFYNGSTLLGSVPLKNGQATFNYSFDAAGGNSMTAVYSGDNTYLPSTSPVLVQKVWKANSHTSLTSSQNPSNQGQPVTFTATLSGQYGGIPTGNVVFRDNGNFLAQVNLNNGVAKYTTSKLSKGQHRITANYGGDNNFHPSSNILIQTVK